MLGILLLALASPLMLLVALLIKPDSPGPVFFRQLRQGFNSNFVRVWKFRTMDAGGTSCAMRHPGWTLQVSAPVRKYDGEIASRLLPGEQRRGRETRRRAARRGQRYAGSPDLHGVGPALSDGSKAFLRLGRAPWSNRHGRRAATCLRGRGLLDRLAAVSS